MNIIIERALHDKEHPYTMISQSLIKDETLSTDARFFLIYILAAPFGWQFNIEGLSSQLKHSKKSIYKIIKECIENGYISKEQNKNGSLYGEVKYYIHEQKFHEQKIQKMLPLSHFGKSENIILNDQSITENQEPKEIQKMLPLSHSGHAHFGHIARNIDCLRNKECSPPTPQRGTAAADCIQFFNHQKQQQSISKQAIKDHLAKDGHSDWICQEVMKALAKQKHPVGNIYRLIESIAERISPDDNAKKNAANFHDWKKRMPNRMADWSVDEKFVYNKNLSKDISLKLEPEIFMKTIKDIVCNIR